MLNSIFPMEKLSMASPSSPTDNLNIDIKQLTKEKGGKK